MQKLSYDKGITGIPLKTDTIIRNLAKTVELFGSREALIVKSQGYRATYAEFFEEVKLAAKALMVEGIKKGDRVGIWAPNRYEWVIIQYATAFIGAILVNINPAYKSKELQYALNQSGLRMLIMSKGFRKTDYMEILSKVRENITALQHIVVLETNWTEFLKKGEFVSDESLWNVEASLDTEDPINIQYTSGTTGYPKGATLTHYNILNNGFFIGERMHYSENDRVCIPVPFYHCFGMVLGNLACTTHGSCMVIPGETFDPVLVMQTVQDEKCTSLYGVPMMFIAELAHPDFKKFDFSSLRTGIMAGALCPEDTMRKVQSKMNMKEVTICYGMTETSPVSTQSFTTDPLERLVTTVGRVHPHVEIKIIDPETGEVLPRGERGEICTRGYSVMKGYWENELVTRQVIDEEGWMHTGDIAEMDEEGFVKITGRIKDMILRGGENISPFEIEEYLQLHDKVETAQVIGVPCFKYGEEVMAWVKPLNGYSLTNEELSEFCRGQIATYKIPKYWKFVEEFPATVTGKIRKVEMREISARELNLQGRENN
ncbi:MAG: AMP-binding protein [Bacteroidota bacterium]